MRWRDSVRCRDILEIRSSVLTGPTVFRSAHGSSNAMREWMGETKKKR